MSTEKIPYHRPLRLSEDEMKGIYDEIDGMLALGQFTNNSSCRELERWFTEYYHCKHAIATANCTLGMLISLQAMRQQFHLENICHTPAFAWESSRWALETAGFQPYYEDIDPNTWIMYDKHEEFALPVHTFGNTAQNSSKRVLYDGAHALGAKLPDLGDATVFSLAPTKIITSIEGGIIITDNDLLAANMIALRDKTARLSELHALFGLAYLKHLPEVLKWKLVCFQKYWEYFKELEPANYQTVPYSHNWNTIGFLTDKKIPASIEIKRYYDPLIHGMKNTDYVRQHIVCLPSWFNCPVDEVIKRIKAANE